MGLACAYAICPPTRSQGLPAFLPTRCSLLRALDRRTPAPVPTKNHRWSPPSAGEKGSSARGTPGVRQKLNEPREARHQSSPPFYLSSPFFRFFLFFLLSSILVFYSRPPPKALASCLFFQSPYTNHLPKVIHLLVILFCVVVVSGLDSRRVSPAWFSSIRSDRSAACPKLPAFGDPRSHSKHRQLFFGCHAAAAARELNFCDPAARRCSDGDDALKGIFCSMPDAQWATNRATRLRGARLHNNADANKTNLTMMNHEPKANRLFAAAVFSLSLHIQNGRY